MLISKRKYYRNFYLLMIVAGLLIFISGSVANKYLFHIDMIDKICRYAILLEIAIIGMAKLKSVEAEMLQRMEKLQPELDKNPKTLAVDIGYKPMLVVIEEYISLQASLDKKQKEELERRISIRLQEVI